MYTLSGTCTYSGGTVASGVTVKIHRNTNGSYDETVLASLISDANGVFSGTWINDTDNVYAIGYYNNGYVGRSNSVISSNIMDIIIRNPRTSGDFSLVLNDSSFVRRVFIIS